MNVELLPTAERLQRVGLGYRKTYRDGIVFTLNRLRESRGELSAELTVEKDWSAVSVHEYLASFRWNLSSLSSRKTAAAHLSERLPDPDIRWINRLHLFATEVLADRRQGPDLEF